MVKKNFKKDMFVCEDDFAVWSQASMEALEAKTHVAKAREAKYLAKASYKYRKSSEGKQEQASYKKLKAYKRAKALAYC